MDGRAAGEIGHGCAVEEERHVLRLGTAKREPCCALHTWQNCLVLMALLALALLVALLGAAKAATCPAYVLSGFGSMAVILDQQVPDTIVNDYDQTYSLDRYGQVLTTLGTCLRHAAFSPTCASLLPTFRRKTAPRAVGGPSNAHTLVIVLRFSPPWPADSHDVALYVSLVPSSIFSSTAPRGTALRLLRM